MALTAEQAAARLNRTERTVRRWIATGELKAFHPTHGRKDKYLIEEREVETLAQELAKDEQPGRKQGPAKEDVSSLAKEVEKLRREIVDLKTDVKALEQLYYKLQGNLPGPDGEASPRPLQKRTEATRTKGRPLGSVTQAETPKELPSGSIILKDFAEKYGVRPMTFRDHIKIGRYGEKVAAEKIFKRDTAKGPEYEYWLTPEQQLAALDFWKRHNVPFTLPHEEEQQNEALESS